MNSATDPMLEALAIAHPLGLRISDLYQNLQALETETPSENTFYRARDDCLENGYIERVDSEADLYRITDDGIDYLEGEVEELELDLPDD